MRPSARGGHHKNVATDRAKVAHQTFNECDGFSVRRPRRKINLERRFVDGLHQTGRHVEDGKVGDPPIVVAIAERGGDDKVEIVRRPVIFVDIGVGGRDLAKLAGGDIDESEALFEEGVLNFAGFRSFGDQRSGGARGVFRKENGDGLAVRRKFWRSQKTFHIGEALCELAGCVLQVQLQLTGFGGIGEKGDAAAVRGPGDVALGSRSSCRRSDFSRGSLAVNRGGEDCIVAGFRAVFVAKFFDPGDFFAVGRYHSLSEAAGSGERMDGLFNRGRDFLFFDVVETLFDSLLGSFLFL